MIRNLKVACVQLNAGEDYQRNLDRLAPLIQIALKKRCRLIALPEVFVWRGRSQDLWSVAHRISAQVLRHFQHLARLCKAYFLLGSLLFPASNRKVKNVSILLDPDGAVCARYEKIHLFDTALGEVETRESRHVTHGKKLVTGHVEGVKAGLSICYDLRFPELYRKLTFRGARILFVPSNFTAHTGKAHWEHLLRARAIENQAFVIAPGQCGIHPYTGIKSYGHSMIVDPWGVVLAEGDDCSEMTIDAKLDFEAQNALRRSFPVLRHARLI